MPSQAAGECVSCCVCDSSNRALACPGCINNTLLFERRKVLTELSEKREALKKRLNSLLDQRQGLVEHQIRRQQLESEAREARGRAQQAERALAEAKRAVERLRASNAARRAAASRAAAELAARRTEHLARHPTLLRYQALTASHVQSMLLAEQRSKLAALLETLPLRISAIRSAGGPGGAAAAAPVQVTLCNLKLPDSASISSLVLQQPEATASALGYLLLLLELLSTYLGGPLLHEGSFQGSTSVVWQQHSFWNRRPSSSHARLPLFMEEGGGGPSALANALPKVLSTSTWGVGLSSQSAVQHAGAGRGAGGGLSRAPSSPPSTSGAGSGGGGGDRHAAMDEALVRQRHADLRLAYDMLLRSLACFVRDKVQPLGLQLPYSWGPCGWLVVLCATVRQDPSMAGVLTAAAQSIAAAAAAGPGGGGDMRFGGSGADGDGGGGHEHTDDEEDAEAEEEGWDMVKAPLVPPPSQPDEVEHWTRAMFTDASARARMPQHGGGAAAAGAAALRRALTGGVGPPAMSLERVRSIFGK